MSAFCPVAASVHAHGSMLDEAAEIGDAVADMLEDWSLDANKFGEFYADCLAEVEPLLVSAMKRDVSYPLRALFDRYYEDAAYKAVMAERAWSREP